MKKPSHLMIAVLLIVVATRIHAQPAAPAVGDSTATVTAQPDYDVGSLTRTLLGVGWRSIWATPVRVPVFNMSRFAGGVKPTERGGGAQTITLRFVENNGWREYMFRSVDKDPIAQAMPPAIQGTMLGNIIQDQTATQFPAAGLMVPPFLQAIGVLHVSPSLYVMPDDPRLGEHRETFAGMLATVELSPQEAPGDTPGFAGSSKIVNGVTFLETVEEGRQHRLDEREFFAVRLIDFLVNDNDRSPDNVRFARFGSDSAYTWRPIPRDRDRAFFNAGGLLIKTVVRPVYAKVIGFSPRYSLAGLTFESHDLDRRLLQRIDRTAANEIAQRVTSLITDATIEQAISRLPPEWRVIEADRLRTTLRARRDGLTSFANEFYEWLATEVDVHGTDQDEHALITRHDDGRVTVALRGAQDSAAAASFSTRTFIPAETNEVRIFLHGGKDIAVVDGAPSNAITVRIIGGGGDDVLADSAGGSATRFYDTRVGNQFITSSGTRVSFEEWREPLQGQGVKFDSPWRPDWGSSLGFGPTAAFAQGAGLVVGFGPRYQSQGFRRLPHKWKIDANVLLGLANMKPGANLSVDYRAENSPLAMLLNARATKFEEFRFHGYGNDVAEVGSRLSQVEQDLVAIEPAFVWQIGWRTRENLGNDFSREGLSPPGLRPLVGRAEMGPVVFWNDPHPANASPLSDPAIGADDAFGRVGLRLGLTLDRTSQGPVSDRGWTFQGELAGYPPLWDVDESFSTAGASIATYFPLPGDGTHLALRAGGELAAGAYPVQHAPAIGGRRTVRGYGYQRYRGESSTFGSAEVRVPTGTVNLFVKWESGIFGLADAGRVWFDGRSPGGWHSGFGGGFWLSSLGQTISVSYAHGEEHRFYIQRGLSF
ncbi:MAG: hypothetical protein ACR2GK_07270 [Gemmatimonadaceae bacterium]